ncbi:MAG: hypothetical protein IT381_16730 [Deltaproteobacteria bacterium]|nr:hypothetical protein [Deltaproteobacteria bacterium]
MRRAHLLLSAPSVCVCLLSASATHASKASKRNDPAPAVEKKKNDKPAEAKQEAPSREVIKRESKIEFDERVVQGQRAQGAVYLFQRAESRFTSLVKTPSTFRERTVKTVFGE